MLACRKAPNEGREFWASMAKPLYGAISLLEWPHTRSICDASIVIPPLRLIEHAVRGRNIMVHDPLPKQQKWMNWMQYKRVSSTVDPRKAPNDLIPMCKRASLVRMRHRSISILTHLHQNSTFFYILSKYKFLSHRILAKKSRRNIILLISKRAKPFLQIPIPLFTKTESFLSSCLIRRLQSCSFSVFSYFISRLAESPFSRYSTFLCFSSCLFEPITLYL